MTFDLTDAEKLLDEQRYADKLMHVLSKITPKNYEDVVRIATLMKSHDERRGNV